jgi:hypothetical protein
VNSSIDSRVLRRGGLGAILVLLVLAHLAIPTSHASAAGWLPQTNVSPAVPSAGPSDLMSLQDVGVDGQGNSVAAWIQSTIDGPRIIKAATRPAGGTWSASVVVSNTAREPLGLEVVVNPDGDAAIAWIDYRASGAREVSAATRPAGGEWSGPVVVPSVEGETVQSDFAIDGQGIVTAIWAGEVGWEEGVIATATLPVGGEWSEPVPLSDDSLAARSPQLAVDPEGNVTAVWVLNTDNRVDDGTIQSKTRPAGGEWSTEAVDVSGENGLASVPRVAVDAQGDATVVWQQQDIAAGSGFRHFVQTAQRVDGTWSDPLTLSREDGLGQNPELTVDSEGNATAVWSLTVPLSDEPRLLQTRRRTPDGEWSEPYNLVSKVNGFVEPGETDYQLQADAEGNVTAVWTAWAVPTYVVRSAHFATGVGWSVPVTLSVSSGYSIWPRLAVDPQGYATVVWSGYQGLTHAVRSRVLDPIAPQLNDVMVPATGTVGQPVAMSVNPFDVWPPVATAWDFGDGGSGSGAAVSHCYSTPSEYTVTLTGTDAAANSASDTRTIEIDPDPSLAPGSDPCDFVPPSAPQLTSTDPTSPALGGTPRIRGAAEAGSTVRVYAGPSCAGTPVASRPAAELASPGIPVDVAEGATAVFSATATDASANSSACSAPISYTRMPHGDPPPPPPPPPACVVPKLIGKKLVRAKDALALANCKLGTVRRPDRPSGKGRRALVVKSSTPGAGANPAGLTVDLRLGPKPKKAH